MPTSLVHQVAVIGTHLPRQCGIATFTTHLCEALTDTFPDLTLFTIPVNDDAAGYAYPDNVRFELNEDDPATYTRAADYLNRSTVDLVCVQHEYGIFGGPSGAYILDLLRATQAPIVTTLHTILQDPLPEQRAILMELAQLSDRLIVMSERGSRLLQTVYGIAPATIQIIAHGVPDVPFLDPAFYKDQFDAEGRRVLLTFGLLSENKGIETVIAALPAIVEQFPDLLYVILGTTHPHVKHADGERYRQRLIRQARELGVSAHVRFDEAFVDEDRLLEYIAIADIAITPYHNPAQITSGALAYLVGAGKAIISTPYWYAEELLADGRGKLVPFQDAEAIARAACELLANDGERHAMRKRAYLSGRAMTWPRIARQYLDIFEQVRAERLLTPRAQAGTARLPDFSPAIILDHIRVMTDSTAMLQHAIFTVPNYAFGYTTDDNARALIATMQLEQLALPGCGDSHQLAARYLAFLWYAFQPETGRFHNLLSYDRVWQEEVGSEDCHGRAIWALGTVLQCSLDSGFRGMASLLLDHALPAAQGFAAPRAWAFTLLGLHAYLHEFAGDSAAQRLRETLAERLLALYDAQHTPTWEWFEPQLTYDNATLARALLLAGHAMRNDTMVQAALRALAWLNRVQRPEGGHFVPVGCLGFYTEGGVRARFDQQPIEAYATIAANLDAYRLTGQESWREAAANALAWFYGQNDLQRPLFQALTGGCFDGLQPDHLNQNQGAESSLAFLLSILEFRTTPEPLPDVQIKRRRTALRA